MAGRSGTLPSDPTGLPRIEASRAFSTCRADLCPSAFPAPDRRDQSLCDVPRSRSEASRERASSSVTSRRSLRALSNQAW